MRLFTRIFNGLLKRIGNWAQRRHGIDPDPVTIRHRRIYILPTRLGLLFALMAFAMMLGGMNYANNLALALAFMLGALGLVAMHHCHRNLAGVVVTCTANEPVFAGQHAQFNFTLQNPVSVMRHELVAVRDDEISAAVTLAAQARATVRVAADTHERGWLKAGRIEILSRHPFGLFRAWTVLHLDHACLVYPAPAPPGEAPPPVIGDEGSSQPLLRGDEDFAGFRSWQIGDSPRHIAWKAYARGHELLVTQYAGAAVTSHLLDFDSLPHLDVEARLSRLCRWVLDAHTAGHAYGLRLPGRVIEPGLGSAHREHCLAALALFGHPGAEIES